MVSTPHNPISLHQSSPSSQWLLPTSSLTAVLAARQYLESASLWQLGFGSSQKVSLMAFFQAADLVLRLRRPSESFRLLRGLLFSAGVGVGEPWVSVGVGRCR